METRAEYETGTDEQALFAGFAPPTENWSKLPHALIEALPLIETLGEMKVILYVLRHTWGYHDEEKKIATDEFCNGRKRRDGSRIDGGIGMSKPTVIDAIERATKHGFIEVEVDERDQGRVKKFYSLSSLGVKKLDTSDQETLHRSEKETLERNLEDSVTSVTGGDAPPPAPEEPPQEDKPKTPQAVLKFRSATHRYPAKAWWAEIAERVGDQDDKLKRWYEVCHAWVGLGWNPVNVKGMLDHFVLNKIPGEERRTGGPSTPREAVGASGYRVMPRA
jgi:DNA-binding MarR family transcriptional regulator